MIPLKYREQLPPYWYDNEVAETHFEAAGGEFDYQTDNGGAVLNQFLLPYATWGMDYWDWIYFGEKQVGSHEQRRDKVRKKKAAKAKFTLPTLKVLANHSGILKQVSEDFDKKEICFQFHGGYPINLAQLHEDFEQIRPIHVKRANFETIHEPDEIRFSASVSCAGIEYPICNAYYAGGFDVE